MIEQSQFLSAEHEQQIRDFTMYANFIANQFGIQVVLDTHQAHTDGKVISLPNVTDLSEDELNAVYAILLHEAGHIRHSVFSDDYFSQLTTELQAFFANCFEDARIENLLCTEFDGAKNMFEQLYTVHAINPAINYRLFGFHERNGDAAFSFGAFLHNVKCNFATADIIDIDPRATKVVKFLQNNIPFIEQIQNHPLKTPQDAIELSKIAYTYFTTKFKDTTDKISIKEDSKRLNQLKNTLDDLTDQTTILESALEEAAKERKEKEKDYRQSISSVAAELEQLKASAAQIKKCLSSVGDFYRAYSNFQKAEEKIQRNTARNNSSENIQKNDMESIERRFNKIKSIQKSLPESEKVLPSKTLEQVKQELNSGTLPSVTIPKTNNEDIDNRLSTEISRLEKNMRDYANRRQAINSRNSESASKQETLQDQMKRMKEQFEASKKTTPFNPNEFQNDHLADLAQMKDLIDSNENKSVQSIQDETNANANQDESLQDDELKESTSDFDNQDQMSADANSNGHANSQSANSPSAGNGDGISDDDSHAQNNEDSDQSCNLQSRHSELMEKINKLESPFAALKEAVSNAKNKEQSVQAQIEQAISKAFMESFSPPSQGGKGGNVSQLPFEHPMDMLFQDTPGWDDADSYQKNFDQRATQETGSLIINGEKLAGSGKGNRSISVLLKTMKNDVEQINLADCFKDVYAGSMMEQHNQAGFENFGAEKGRAVNTDSYIASFATTGKHTILSTQFDKIEMLNYLDKGENQTRNLMNDRISIVNRLKDELKKKMKVTKKPRFVGAKDEGDLDSRNLWKIPARRGSDVFEQNNPKFVNNVAATILADISGSLNNDSTKEGMEMKFIVGALSEALMGCYVNHEVLGYHAPYSDELAELKSDASYNRRNHYLETVVFKNFKQKDNAGIDNLELQSSDNSDGESLRIAMKRLLQQRAKNRVIFMVTDAKPFLTGANVLKLDKDLYEALQEAKRKKIQVVGIGFNNDKMGIFGNNFLHIKDNSYEDLIQCIKNLDLKGF